MTSADKEIVICDSFDGYVLDNSKAYVNLARKLVKKSVDRFEQPMLLRVDNEREQNH